MSNEYRLLRRTKAVGIHPDNLALPLNSHAPNDVAHPTSSGKVPLRSFSDTIIVVSDGNPHTDAIVPLSWLRSAVLR